jgi:hypothetical protein
MTAAIAASRFTRNAGNLGKQAGIFHGQGGVRTRPGRPYAVLPHCQSRLDPVLRKETVPLLLARVDYLLPSSVKHLFHLLERHLAGSDLRSHQLHERSWEIIVLFRSAPAEALENSVRSWGRVLG